jgi:hypothetical protein
MAQKGFVACVALVNFDESRLTADEQRNMAKRIPGNGNRPVRDALHDFPAIRCAINQALSLCWSNIIKDTLPAVEEAVGLTDIGISLHLSAQAHADLRVMDTILGNATLAPLPTATTTSPPPADAQPPTYLPPHTSHLPPPEAATRGHTSPPAAAAQPQASPPVAARPLSPRAPAYVPPPHPPLPVPRPAQPRETITIHDEGGWTLEPPRLEPHAGTYQVRFWDASPDRDSPV